MASINGKGGEIIRPSDIKPGKDDGAKLPPLLKKSIQSPLRQDSIMAFLSQLP